MHSKWRHKPKPSIRTTLRDREREILVTYGEPVGDGLRIPAAVANREIRDLRRKIAAFERVCATQASWTLA